MLESLDPGARKILQECEVSKGSRYAEVLSSLSRVGGKEAAPAEACCVNPSPPREDAPRDEVTRELLYELRKIRERELYEIEALNALQYVPDDYRIDDPKIEEKLKSFLCERSNAAIGDEIRAEFRNKAQAEALLKRSNDCLKQGSEISKMIELAARDAIRSYQQKGLRKPGESDLRRLNADLGDLFEGCKAVGDLRPKAPLAVFDSKNEAKYRADNPNGPGFAEKIKKQNEELRYQQNTPPEQRARDRKSKEMQKRLIESTYQSKVLPVIQRIFTSPYGRLLANSSHLQAKIGLEMDRDWRESGFCQWRINGKPLRQTDINIGYFGSPTQKIDGVKAITRKNLGSLAMTRVPELRDRFWRPLDAASFGQRAIAEAQQQVAYELLYQAKSDEVRVLLQSNRQYADLACNALEHESLWEKESVRNGMNWARNVAAYGGIGVGLVGGFFSGGAGWAMAATLASGLALSTTGSALNVHADLQGQKAVAISEELNVQSALIDQAGGSSAESANSANSSKDFEEYLKATPEEQEKILQHLEEFEAALVIENGKVISKGRSPEEIRDELLKSAKSARERFLIENAYSIAMTGLTLGVGSGLRGLAVLAKAKNLTKIEQVAKLGAKLEARTVGPSDLADAFGTCLVLDDCSGTGLVVGAGIKKGSTNLKKLFSAYRKRSSNRGRSDQDLCEDIAEAIERESKGQVRKESVLAVLLSKLGDMPDWGVRVLKTFRMVPKSLQKRAMIMEYPLHAKNLGEIPIRDQNQSGTCALHAACTMLEMNGAFPEGKTLDMQYIDGLRVWERMSSLLSYASGHVDPDWAKQQVSEIVGGGNSPGDILDLFSARAIPYIDSKDAVKTQRMFQGSNRAKLEKDLQGLMNSGAAPEQKLRELDRIMKSYYGDLEVNRDSSRRIRGRSFTLLENHSRGRLQKAKVQELGYKRLAPARFNIERLKITPGASDGTATIMTRTGRDLISLNQEDLAGIQSSLQPVDARNLASLNKSEPVFLQEQDGTLIRLEYQPLFRAYGDSWGRTIPDQILENSNLFRSKEGEITVKNSQVRTEFQWQTHTKLKMKQAGAEVDEIEKNILHQLLNGKSVYLGVENVEYQRNGKLRYNPIEEGSHAMVIVGAKQNKDGSIRELLLANSWGEGVGQNGYYSMPWDQNTKSQVRGILFEGSPVP